LPFGTSDRNQATVINLPRYFTRSGTLLALLSAGERLRVGMLTALALTPVTVTDLHEVAATLGLAESPVRLDEYVGALNIAAVKTESQTDCNARIDIPSVTDASPSATPSVTDVA